MLRFLFIQKDIALAPQDQGMGPVLAEYKKQFTALALCKRGHFGCLLVEITLI